MSRVGERPIPILDGVTWQLSDRCVTVTGPLGELSLTLEIGISVREDNGVILVSRQSDERRQKELHGLSPVSYTHLTLPTNREV